MKKGQIYEGLVEQVDFPDKGIIHVDGQKVTVKHGLPGQRLKFMITKKKSNKLEGQTLEILEKSPQEKKDGVCPHFGQCGGCTYNSFPADVENQVKKAQMRRLLEPIIGEGIFEGVKEPPRQREYRNKMEFSFGDEYKDGPLALGMHRRGSFYDVLTVSDCQIVDGDFRKIFTVTRDYFAEKRVSFYRKMQHIGYLRHLMVRKAAATGEIVVDLVTTSQIGELPGVEYGCAENVPENAEKSLLDGFSERLQGLLLGGTLVGVLHTVNDSLADVVQSDRTDILYGRDYFYEKLLGLTFKITPFSFFQTNSLGAEVLYETAREYIGETKDKVIYDLYSGTGTIAQILAPVAEKVVGVEIVEEAVEAANINAKLNGLDNCEFIAGDVLKVLDSLTEKPDLIVLDPPRDGIHPKALPKIIGYGVDRLIYISCKPTSLVRDLPAFYEGGYRVTRACSVNMFCGTSQVETICLLQKGNRKPDTYVNE